MNLPRDKLVFSLIFHLTFGKVGLRIKNKPSGLKLGYNFALPFK